MGVQIYILEQRMVALSLDDLTQEIGTLRRSWKVTEFDQDRGLEIEKATADMQDGGAPIAAMLADFTEMPLAGQTEGLVKAHLVLGWDSDRSSVTDFGWDYLPVLGFAVRAASKAVYVLHEDTKRGLLPMRRSRAVELSIIDPAGTFIRNGQPAIISCKSVNPYIAGYVEADCLLSDKRTAKIITATKSTQSPKASWYVGRRPRDSTLYRGSE